MQRRVKTFHMAGIPCIRSKAGMAREFIEDFDVFISENGNVYRYLLNNANFESRVKIVKKDAESGNIVPQAGHGYEIYSPNGEKIVMEMTYPEVIEIDTFYTDSNGYLITPEPLPYGEGYYIVEVETVEPYVLDPTPVYFDITPDSAEDQAAYYCGYSRKGKYASERNHYGQQSG